jgi:phenylacetyl-CoA:acceptor oxidoreductase subunit 2
MSGSTRGSPYGFAPWHQTSWDWRAAGNFIGGGAGCGLVVFAALSPAAGPAQAGLFLAGLALVGIGLFCVSLELGRPLRALNVIRNPLTSWMSREALCAALLAVSVFGILAGVEACRWAAAIAALGFLYCQARLLQGAKGIPAWRDPTLVPLVVATGLAEGGGLFWLGSPVHRAGTLALLGLFVVLVIVRYLVWRIYRHRVDASLAAKAGVALDGAGRRLHYAGTWAPIVLAALAVVAPSPLALALAAAAGLMAAAAGALVKHALVTRAGFNQGFALPQVPVRGVRP